MEGVKDIKCVSITEDELHVVYEISAKDLCGGDCIPCLSLENSTEESKRLTATSEWIGAFGKLIVEKSLIPHGRELYLYIFDKDSGMSSTVVKVYAEKAQLEKWMITEEGYLVLRMNRNSTLFSMSSQLILMYTDRYKAQKTCRMNLPEMRVGLDELDILPEDLQFSFTLEYLLEDGTAKIYGAPTSLETIYPARPIIQSVNCSEKVLSVVLEKAPDSAFVTGELKEDGTSVKCCDLTDNKMDVSDIVWNPEAFYTLVLWYRNEKGISLKSNPVTVITRMPELAFCTFENDMAKIRLAEKAVYQISHDGKSEYVKGNVCSVPATTKGMTVCLKKGLATGPEIKVEIKQSAYYPLQAKDGRVYYFYGERPDETKTDQDISTVITKKMEGLKGYEGTCFVVKPEESGEIKVTIKKERYTLSADDVRTDYTSMIESLAKENISQVEDLLFVVRQTVQEKMPMDSEDAPFFCYDYAPWDGYTGICEGMCLQTEYSVYQNVPEEEDASQFAKGLSGFSGSGTARYLVIKRNGKLTVDPFVGSMNFDVPAPATMVGDNKLQGGAGISDLLFKNFSNPLVRLVYPVTFSERTGTGNLVYADNICLITASQTKYLLDATANMRRRKTYVVNACYHYFRGRSVIIPQIRIEVNGNKEWVSLGTRLGDILTQYDAEKALLYRRKNRKLYPVISPVDEMILLIGDKIEL